MADPNDTGSVTDSGISAQWVDLPNAPPLTPGADTTVSPSVPESMALATGGALDLAQHAPQVAQTDALSSYRIGQLAGLSDPSPAPVASPDQPVPDVPPATVPSAMRYDYADQLRSGQTSGSQDYAEKKAADSYQDATWTQPANWNDHAAQITNAAKGLSASLPDHDELDTYSTYLAQQHLGSAPPEAVQGIKDNLLDAWAETGTAPQQLVQGAQTNPDLAQQLTTPPPPSLAPHYPTREDLSPAALKDEEGLHDPFGDMTTDPTGLGGLVHLPAQELANQAKVHEMRGATNPDGTPKYTTSEIFDQSMQSPVLQFAAQLALGKFAHQGIDAATGSQAAQALRGMVKDTLADTTGTASQGTPLTFGGLGRLLRNNLTIDETKAVTGQRLAAAADIRKSVGQATAEKALTKVALEAHRAALEPGVPGFGQYITQLQKWGGDVAYQRAMAPDPAAFDANSVPGKPVEHPFMSMINHMEGYPGAAPLPTDHSLFKFTQDFKQAMEDRRQGLETDVNEAKAQGRDPMSFIDQYVPHQYLDPEKKINEAFGYGRQGSTGATRERTIPYMQDAISRGLTPAHLNPYDMAMHYVVSIDDFRAAERIRNRMIDSGQAYYDTEARAPGDKPLDGRGATRQRLFNDEAGAPQVINEKLFAPRGYAQVYNNWLSKGWQGVGKTLYDKWMTAKNASLGMSFGISGFHPLVMYKQSLGAAIGEGKYHFSQGNIGAALAEFGMAPVALVRDIYRGKKWADGYMQSQPFNGVTDRMSKLWQDAGGVAPNEGRGDTYFASEGRNLLSDWNRAGAWGINNLSSRVARGTLKTAAALPAATTELAKSFVRGSARTLGKPGEHPVMTAAYFAPRALDVSLENFGRITDTISAPIFDMMIPLAKRGVIGNHMENFMRYNKLASEEDVLAEMRRTMDRVDNTHGEMNMRNIFGPQKVKQLANALTVSMGWEYGSARMMGKAGEDAILGGSEGRFSQHVRTVLGYTLGMGLLNLAYQYYKTGTTPFSTGYSGFAMPQTRPNDPTSAVMVPGEEKEITRIASLYAQAGTDPLKLMRAPFEYVAGKGNQIVEDVEAFMGQKNMTKFLQRLQQNHMPANIWQDRGGASLTPFERLMGNKSAPNVLTGAPEPSTRPPRAPRPETHGLPEPRTRPSRAPGPSATQGSRTRRRERE